MVIHYYLQWFSVGAFLFKKPQNENTNPGIIESARHASIVGWHDTKLSTSFALQPEILSQITYETNQETIAGFDSFRTLTLTLCEKKGTFGRDFGEEKPR